MSVLVSCKKCYAARIVGIAGDKCRSCGSPEITVSRATELDPANPSAFGPTKKGEIAAPLSSPLWLGRDLDTYEWDTYEWNSPRETEGFSGWMGIDRAPSASNAHASEMADYRNLTLLQMEQSYNRAARGLQWYGGVRGVPGVDTATGPDRTVVSQLTAEWKIPEPKPVLKSERVQFPVERKITVK